VRLILKATVDNLGGAGDVVDVADGYANNYLVPRGLAMKASKGALADADAMRAARGKRDARTLEDAERLRATLESAPIRIQARAGEDGTLYGSIGTSAIADRLREQYGVTIDRRRMALPRPIKTTGTQEVEVRVHPQLTATVRVEVVGGR
jgi:large subunit ribosomal protein L9